MNLTKDVSAAPNWAGDARAWLDESKAVHRIRRRRALPVKIATLATMVLTLGTLAVVDSITGIPLVTYFWTCLVIVVAGLLVGLALRRTPWAVATLLPVLIAGSIAFAGSHTRIGDGIGDRQWHPTTVSAEYRLAFGRGVLDLRSLPAQSSATTIHVRLGAGQVKILAPSSMDLTVRTSVHIGRVVVDGDTSVVGHGGVEFDRTVAPPATATGAPVTVDVDLTDGEVDVERV